MPTSTTNYNLTKPGQEEFYDVSVPNANMDKIDAALKSLSDALGGIDLTTIQNQLTQHLAEDASLTKKGHTQLSSSTTSTIESMAATPKAVKTVNDSLDKHSTDLVAHGVYGEATGINALTMTVNSVTEYITGMLVAFKNTTANTGAATLNINNLGAKSIKKANGNDLGSNNLKTGGIYQLRYDGVNFMLLGEGGEYGNANASDVLKGKTVGTEGGIITGTLLPLIAGEYKIKEIISNPPTTSSQTLVKVKGYRITGLIAESSIRIRIGIYSGNATAVTSAQIYINGVPTGLLRSASNTNVTYFTEDFIVNNNDLIDLYIKGSNGYTAYVAAFEIKVSVTLSDN